MVRRPSRVHAATATALLLKRQLAVTLALATAVLATHALALAPLQNKQQTSKKVSKDYAKGMVLFCFYFSDTIQRFATQESSHVVCGDVDEATACSSRSPCNVRRDVAARCGDERTTLTGWFFC